MAPAIESKRLVPFQQALIWTVRTNLQCWEGKILITTLCIKTLTNEAIEPMQVIMPKAAKKLGLTNLFTTAKSIISDWKAYCHFKISGKKKKKKLVALPSFSNISINGYQCCQNAEAQAKTFCADLHFILTIIHVESIPRNSNMQVREGKTWLGKHGTK